MEDSKFAKADELLEKLLEDHPRELIMGALNEMQNMSAEQLDSLGELCKAINGYEDKTSNL